MPSRVAGSFPTYLYKSLDELEGIWPDGPYATSLIERAHRLHHKPLLALSDTELDLALSQKIGLPWILELTLQRLRQDPLREGEIGSGDLLRRAMELPASDWGKLLPELETIADAIVPTLVNSGDDGWLDEWVVEPYRRFKNR